MVACRLHVPGLLDISVAYVTDIPAGSKSGRCEPCVPVSGDWSARGEAGQRLVPGRSLTGEGAGAGVDPGEDACVRHSACVGALVIAYLRACVRVRVCTARGAQISPGVRVAVAGGCHCEMPESRVAGRRF